MKHFGLIIFFVLMCSNYTIQQTPLTSTFAPMGHALDCADRCKTCVDENTFNEVYKEYTKSMTSIPSEFKDDAFQTLLVKKASDQKKAVGGGRLKAVHRLDSKLENDLTDEEKIENEVAKSEESLDQEVQVAVDKVTKVEGEQNSEKIKDIATRIRSRMVEKYRKEAAKRLNINYESNGNDNKGKLKLFRKFGVSAENTNKVTQAPQDPDSVFKVYFEICVEAGSVFYARAP